MQDPIAQHYEVKSSRLPNFSGVRLPVQSQLIIPECSRIFASY